jgi:hypothetical protein
MATYCPPSGQIKFSQIKAAFGNNKNNLSQYRSLRWYKNPFAYGNFPAASIKFSDFYSTGDTVTPTPANQTVVIGGVTYNYTRISSSLTTNIGAFNVMSIAVVGGGGGVQGSSGNTGAAGSGGSPGGTTSMTTSAGTTSAAGGAAVLSPGSPSNGSTSQVSWSAGANANLIGTSITVSIGAGGAGGTGGPNFTTQIINGVAVNVDNGTKGATGASGSAGYVDIYWY